MSNSRKLPVPSPMTAEKLADIEAENRERHEVQIDTDPLTPTHHAYYRGNRQEMLGGQAYGADDGKRCVYPERSPMFAIRVNYDPDTDTSMVGFVSLETLLSQVGA